VNEEGTEAAAATGIVMRSMAMAREPPPIVFRADHPFVFLIRDNRSGGILFMGRVTDPTK
jgi:serpin B